MLACAIRCYNGPKDTSVNLQYHRQKCTKGYFCLGVICAHLCRAGILWLSLQCFEIFFGVTYLELLFDVIVGLHNHRQQ